MVGSCRTDSPEMQWEWEGEEGLCVMECMTVVHLHMHTYIRMYTPSCRRLVKRFIPCVCYLLEDPA